MPASEAAERVEALDLAAVAWTDGDIARFLDRRARLLRWGWHESEAEELADRLVRRDREHDERVSCTDCQHYRPGRCGNHRRAGLHAPDVGRDLAGTLQRCPGLKLRGDGMAMCRRFKGQPVARLIVSVPATAVVHIDALICHRPDHPANGCRSEFVRLAIAEKLGRELMLYLPATPKATDGAPDVL